MEGCTAMSESDVVAALVALGFSLNESRAYEALLQDAPATGYEVGVRAQIPRSAVYGVLRRLVKEGAARSIPGTPERFVPAPSADLVALLRKRFEGSVGALEQAIARLDVTPPVPDAFSVHGYARVLEEAASVVRRAESTLIVSGWPRELRALEPAARDAAAKGVFVVAFSHADIQGFPGEVFSYGLAEADLEAFWQHRLSVVADDRVTLVASAEGSDRDTGVVSETKAIAEVTTSQVALDVTLLAQRSGRDIQATMARMLGSRVGNLDGLLKRTRLP
jgi:sugar-specific transcriptional regulator TrmB